MAGIRRSVFDDIETLQLPDEAMPTGSGGSVFDEIERGMELDSIQLEARNRNQGGVSRELEAGWEQTKGSIARTVGEFTGWQGAKNYADERAAEAQGLSEASGFTQSWDEVDGIGSGASYVAKATLNTIPAIAGMAVPGGAAFAGARALGAGITAARTAGLSTAFASNAAQQTGGNLDAQIEEGGEVDLMSAGAAGLAQAGLDTFTGVGGRVLSGLRAPVTEVGEQVARGAINRFGRKMVRTAGEEFAAEGAQQVLQEAARSQVTPEGEEFDMAAAQKRVVESAVTGGLVGGVLGGALPAGNRRREVAPVPSADPNAAGTDPTVTAEADAKGELATTETPPAPRAPSPVQPDLSKMSRAPSDGEIFTVTPEGDIVLARAQGQAGIIAAVRGNGTLTKPVRELAREVQRAVETGDVAAARSFIDQYEGAVLREGRLAAGELDTLQPAIVRARNVLDEFERTRLRRDLARTQPTIGSLGVFHMDPQLERPVIADESLLRNAIAPTVDGKFTNNKIAKLANFIRDAVRVEPDFPGTVSQLREQLTLELARGNLKNSVADAYMNGIAVLDDFAAVLSPPAPVQDSGLVDAMAGPGIPIAKEGAQLGQAVVDANVAQMQAQQAATQPVAVPQAELNARKQAVAEAKVAQQEADLQPVQYDPAQLQMTREALLREVQSDPAGGSVVKFMSKLKAAKVFGENPLPTDAEVKKLAKTARSIGKAEGVKSPTSTLPEKFEQANPAQAALVEEPARPAPGTANKQQQAQLDRVGRIKALKPMADTDALRSMMAELGAKFEALNETLGDTFGSQLDALINNISNMQKLNVGDRLKQVKQVRDALAAIEKAATPGTQGALPLSFVGTDAKAAIAARAPKEPAAAAAPEPTTPAAEDAQLDFFTETGKVRKAAANETNAQVRDRIDELATRPPKGDANAHIKQLQLRRLERAIGAAGVSNRDINGVVDTIINPNTTPDDAKALVDTTLELAGMPLNQSVAQPTRADAPVQEEADNAVFQEPDEDTAERFSPASGRRRPPENPAQTQAEAWLNEITKDWTNMPDEVFVFDPDAPRNPREAVLANSYNREADRLGQPPYKALYQSYRDGTRVVAIPLEFATDRDTIKGLVFHEVLGHYGLEIAFRGELDNILRQMYRGNPKVRELANQLREAARGQFEVKNPQLYFTEEALAEVSETGADYSRAIKSAYEAIRDWLVRFARRMGLTERFTDSEVRAVLRAAHAKVQRGAPDDGARTFRTGVGRLSPNTAQPAAPSFQRADAPISSIANAPEILKSRSMGLRSTLSARGVPEPLINLAVVASDTLSNIKLGTLLGRNLMEEAVRKGLPSAKRLFDIQQAVMAKTNEYVKTLDQLVVDAMNLDSVAGSVRGKTPKRDALNKYIKAATISGKWGYQPTWKTEPVKIDPKAKELTDKFRAEFPDAFAVADAMFQYSDKARADLQTAVTKYIENETAGDLANALTAEERQSIEERKQRELKLFNKMVPKLDGPYAPLSRFGKYAAVAKSARFVELENKVKSGDASKAERAELGNLRVDPNHYAVFFRDSQADADVVLLEKLQKNPAFKGGQLYSALRSETFEQIGESPIMQMQRFKDLMVKELGETDKLGRKTTRDIENLVKDLYIRTLAETSARQHDQYREGIDGADDDMLRSFAQKGRADAHILAQITDRYEIGQVMQTMINKESSVRDEGYQERKRVLREVLMRHNQQMMAEETPIQDKLMAASSLYHLAMSPRYYLMNSLQPWMVSAPYLAGKHGGRAYGALYDAYKAIGPQMKSAEFWKGKVDLSKLKGVSRDEIEALQKMQFTGLLELGQQYDQGYWEASDGPARFMSEATHVFRTLSGQVEYINRVSSALAAYRLSGGKVEAMEDVLARTQFDYSNRNQPRYFNMLPKVVTQFRKYQLGQLALWLGMIKDSKTSPEARRALAYMTGQLALVTGAVGLPAAQLFGVIGSAIFKDDDEPLDGEKWLTDLVGGGVAARGIGTLVGVELANGLGLGTLHNPFPFLNYSELDSRDGLRDATFAVLGPSAGLADKAQRGLEAVQQGEYLRALGEALPSGVTNAVRAYELATRGYEKKNGDMLLSPEEVGEVNVFLQALGFAPTVKLNAQRINAQKVVYEEHFKQRTASLKRAYAQAQESRDTGTMREIEAQWEALQTTKDQYGFKKTSRSELLRARAEQKKREKNTIGGVQVRDSNRRFVEQALEQ